MPEEAPAATLPRKHIVIAFMPSLDLRAPEQAQLKIAGFADMLDVVRTLQDVQNTLLAQMAAQRDAAVNQALMVQASQNGHAIRR